MTTIKRRPKILDYDKMNAELENAEELEETKKSKETFSIIKDKTVSHPPSGSSEDGVTYFKRPETPLKSTIKPKKKFQKEELED